MSKSIVILSSVFVLLTACGGGGTSNTPSSTIPNSSSSTPLSSSSSISSLSSSSVNSKSSSSSSAPIDCSHLDPKKVYLLGTLQEGTDGLEALTDPEDPTNFCVGFDSRSRAGIISSKGEYIYAKDNEGIEVYRFAPDEMTQGISGQWEYPKNVLGNDSLLFQASHEFCVVGKMWVQPVTGEIYYSCPNDIIHSQTTRKYYSLINDQLLGIMPDGSLLISGFKGLRLVSKSKEETDLVFPSNYDPNSVSWIRSRYFKDPISGHDMVWIANYDNSSSSIAARRFSLDLTTLKISLDGEFDVPKLNNQNAHISQPILDGDGVLWHIISFDKDIIVKRPLVSSGKQATVIYDEADDIGGLYHFKKKLFVLIHGSGLVTGQ